MSFAFQDATARTAWGNATTQTGQLAAFLALWSGDVTVRYYTSGGTHLGTATHSGWDAIDTSTTPYSVTLAGRPAWSHLADGTAAYCIVAVPGGADIIRADVTLAAAVSANTGIVNLDNAAGAAGLRINATASLPATDLPAWVPTTAWEWANVPTSTWTDYMKTDGSGVAPQITASDPGPTREYAAQWDYSGQCYSRGNHEIYVFGGGHAATTVNAVSRWNLATETPNVSLVCAPSSEANRNTWLQAADYTNKYLSDNKPVSPHSYWNNVYSDATDELISFGLGYFATGYPTASGGAEAGDDVRALTRAGAWRAPGTYGSVTRTLSTAGRGPRMISADGATIYYWDGADASDTTDFRKFAIGTNTHSTIGASVIPFYSLQADGGAGTALVMGGVDSAAGWQAKFVTLSSGSTSSVTVSGDSIPSGQSIVGVEWCPDKGYYLCVWVNTSATGGSGGAVSAITVATITPNYGANTAVASIKTMTGTGPTLVPWIRTAYYDPSYSAVIFVQGHSVPVKVFKVA